ncbi:MAG: hypothetical protein K1X51_13610 [Rhodospirillaceae bacterium]|nr:hypothetical protein [Rhodospirillaceae bacterium]
MSGSVNPLGNLCRVTLDLPWEVAEALADHGTAIIAAIQSAVRARKEDAARSQVQRAETDRQCDQNREDWIALAQKVQAEVARRSNGPGQRPAIVRQLAVEYGVTVQHLNTICQAFGQEVKARRNLEIVRRYFQGVSNRQIAKEHRLTPHQVGRILATQKDLIRDLRANPVELERFRGTVPAGDRS